MTTLSRRYQHESAAGAWNDQCRSADTSRNPYAFSEDVGNWCEVYMHQDWSSWHLFIFPL